MVRAGCVCTTPDGSCSCRAALLSTPSVCGSRPLIAEAVEARLRLGGSAGKMPIKVRKRRRVRSLFLTTLAIAHSSPGGQNVGRVFGTNGKAEDKSAAVNPTIPVFRTASNIVYCYQTGPHGVPTAQKADSPGKLLVIIIQRAERLPSVRAHRLLPGLPDNSAPSLSRLRDTPLGRPVPLPRRLPTAGDRLSFVRMPILYRKKPWSKKFSSVKSHSLFDQLGDECERRQEWRRDQPCHVPSPARHLDSPHEAAQAIQPSQALGCSFSPFLADLPGVDLEPFPRFATQLEHPNHATWGPAREDGLLSGKGVTDERRGPQAWGGESRCQTHIGQY